MDPAACGDRPNFLDFSFQKTVVVSSARALRERAPETRKMTNPADATQVDIAEKENAPSPAVKASPKPAANGDGSSKFVNVDGKVKHRRVVKADGVDAMTHAAATVGVSAVVALEQRMSRTHLGNARPDGNLLSSRAQHGPQGVTGNLLSSWAHTAHKLVWLSNRMA